MEALLINRPAARFLIPFAAGIVIAKVTSLPLSAMVGIAHVAAAVWIATLVLTGGGLARIRPAAAFAVIASCGALSLAVRFSVPDALSIGKFASVPEDVVVMGKVSEYPKSDNETVRFALEATRVCFRNRWTGCAGGVLVTFRLKDVGRPFFDSVAYGRSMAIAGRVIPLSGPRNPGDADLRQYYESLGLAARMLPNHAVRPVLGLQERSVLSAIVYPLRKLLSRRFDRYVGGNEAALLKGMILGDRSEISQDLREAFVNAGVMHIIAVAGLHVGIVSFILISLLSSFRFPRIVRLLLLESGLIFFLLLTGSAIPVVRAVTMATVLIGAAILQRRTDIFNSLALAAIMLLIADPAGLFDSGFQLSFSSVFFIAYLHPRCIGLSRWIPARVREGWVVNAVVELVAVSFSAGVGTLPFTSMYFGKISVVGIVANIAVVPMTGVVFALGAATAALSFVSVQLCVVYAAAAKEVAHALLRVISFFGGLTFSSVDTTFSAGQAALYYGIVVAFANVGKRWVARWLIIGAIAGIDYAVIWPLCTPADPRTLRMTFIDVGQGDAIFLEFPDGRNLLVDSGPRTGTVDAGARFVAPFLRWKGLHGIDAILLTHPDGDHIGGVPYILRHFKVGCIIDGGGYSTSALSKECLHLADSLHVPRFVGTAGKMVPGFPLARLYILNPPSLLVPKDSISEMSFNNQSVVLKLMYGSTSAILSGDAESPAEERMVEAYGDFLRATLLKAGHHGSITSSSTGFLATVQPRMAVVSVGWNNKYGHPSQEVLSRLRGIGCEYKRTDESGAIVLESDGFNVCVKDWH